MPDFKFLKSFMDSELDCDKMDYLLRDSYYCGVNYGKYDLNRLLSSLTIYVRQTDNIILVNYMEEPSSIASESILLQSLIKPINIRRLYVDKPHATDARRIVSELLKEGDDN